MLDHLASLAPLSLPIQGMTCAACAGRVQRALEKIPGVTAASVNLASDTAEVSGTAMPGTLAAAIGRAGYQVAERQLSLGIAGMTCASCVQRVQRALAVVPGVLSVEVSLASETAAVHALANVSEDALGAALHRAGYALRATTVAGEDATRRQARREGWELLAGAALVAPFLVGMVGMALGRDWMPDRWVQLGLATLVQAWLGARFYRAGWAALRAGTGNMDLLVALGTSAAWGLSLWMLLGHGHGAGGHLYFESGAVIILFIRLGKFLEARARRATGAAIRALLELAPRTARRLDASGTEHEVPTADLAAGDRVVVRPGERIPADGMVLEGRSGVSVHREAWAITPAHRRGVRARPGLGLSRIFMTPLLRDAAPGLLGPTPPPQPDAPGAERAIAALRSARASDMRAGVPTHHSIVVLQLRERRAPRAGPSPHARAQAGGGGARVREARMS